uniref:Acid-sensing ion channel 1 n=1 Tax=Macrostomum lignano TaxID=282301 RepID=A0A1I8J7S3_9PLAT
HTTAHGFYKLRVENKAVRRLWMLIICCALIAFGVHIILLAINYLQYIVTVETKYNSEPFVLPDVTFCPNQPYHESVWCRRDLACTQDSNATIPSLGGDLSVQTAFRNTYNFWTAAGEGFIAPEIARYSLRKYTVEANMTRNPVTTVLYCNFRGETCGPWNMTIFFDPLSEACVTVSMTDRRVFQAGEQSALDLMLFSFIFVQNPSVPYYKAITNMERFDFNFGYSMYVHPPNTVPDHSQDVQVSETRNYVISAGIERSKSINSPVKKCAENPSPLTLLQFDKLRSFAYTKDACESVKAQEIIVGRCSCLSEKYLVPSSLASTKPYCHEIDPSLIQYPYTTVANKTVQYIDRYVASTNFTLCWNATVNLTLPCNYSYWSKWNTTYLDSMALAQATGILTRRQCHKDAEAFLAANQGYKESCLKPCETVAYPFSSLSTKLISEFSDKNFQAKLDEVAKTSNLYKEWAINNSVYYGDLERVGKNLFKLGLSTRLLFTRVVLLANGNEGVSTVEKYSYPPEQFWSDVGGVLGLWAGLSIISCTEFIQLLFLMASKFRRNRSRVSDSARRDGGAPVVKDAWAHKASTAQTRAKSMFEDFDNEIQPSSL